jgi:hypothetical protein
MANEQSLGPQAVLGSLLSSQARQCDALERLTVAADAIARSVGSLVADKVKVVLVYPWPSNPSVVRAVLVSSPEEERRLLELLPQFERETGGTSLEEWLARHEFRPAPTLKVNLGQKYTGMFQAADPSRPKGPGPAGNP